MKGECNMAHKVLKSAACMYVCIVYHGYTMKGAKVQIQRPDFKVVLICFIKVWNPQIACILSLYMQHTSRYTKERHTTRTRRRNQIQRMKFEVRRLYKVCCICRCAKGDTYKVRTRMQV